MGTQRTWFKGKVYHFPSVSNSPTNSRENLTNSRTSSTEEIVGSSNANINKFGYPHSPGAYRKTLSQLEDLKKRHPRLGSTSDYLNMTTSVCSEDGDKSNWSSLYLEKTNSIDDDDEFLISSYLDIQAQRKEIEERNAELMKSGQNDIDTVVETTNEKCAK